MKGFSLAESIEENNVFGATSSDQPAAGLEANKVVNDGDGELETKVLVDSKQDDVKVVKVVVWPMSKVVTSQTCWKRLNEKYIKKKKDGGCNSKKITGFQN
ncbi:hypothetical protein Tco_1472375 [Tanacetum coccineum]